MKKAWVLYRLVKQSGIGMRHERSNLKVYLDRNDALVDMNYLEESTNFTFGLEELDLIE